MKKSCLALSALCLGMLFWSSCSKSGDSSTSSSLCLLTSYSVPSATAGQLPQTTSFLYNSANKMVRKIQLFPYYYSNGTFNSYTYDMDSIVYTNTTSAIVYHYSASSSTTTAPSSGVLNSTQNYTLNSAGYPTQMTTTSAGASTPTDTTYYTYNSSNQVVSDSYRRAGLVHNRDYTWSGGNLVLIKTNTSTSTYGKYDSIGYGYGITSAQYDFINLTTYLPLGIASTNTVSSKTQVIYFYYGQFVPGVYTNVSSKDYKSYTITPTGTNSRGYSTGITETGSHTYNSYTSGVASNSSTSPINVSRSCVYQFL